MKHENRSNGLYSDKELRRFWSNVDVRSPDECWPWLAGGTYLGYGVITFRHKRRMAHRVSWEIKHGMPMPPELKGCHSCDNPPCVNPDHIWPGTTLDNVRDAMAKGRLKPPPIRYGEQNYNGKKTECKRGHPLSGDNLIITSEGSRSCRQCQRMHQRIYDKAVQRWKAEPEKNRTRAREWREANLEKERERKRKWREANAEKVRAYMKAYNEANRERLLEAKQVRYRMRKLSEAENFTAGVVTPTGQTVRSGYVEVPVCELQPPFREASQVDKLAERSRGKGRAR